MLFAVQIVSLIKKHSHMDHHGQPQELVGGQLDAAD